MFMRQRHTLRNQAIDARKHSRVHRPFHVGVSALVRSGDSYWTLTGASRKLMRGYCPFRRCGEMEIIDKALLNAHAEEIVAGLAAKAKREAGGAGERTDGRVAQGVGLGQVIEAVGE